MDLPVDERPEDLPCGNSRNLRSAAKRSFTDFESDATANDQVTVDSFSNDVDGDAEQLDGSDTALILCALGANSTPPTNTAAVYSSAKPDKEEHAFRRASKRRNVSTTSSRSTTPEPASFAEEEENEESSDFDSDQRSPSPRSRSSASLDSLSIDKRRRHRTTPDQLRILEEVYTKDKLPNLEVRERLAQQLGMTARRVQIWFQNKRAKDKRIRSSILLPAAPTASSLTASAEEASSSSPASPVAALPMANTPAPIAAVPSGHLLMTNPQLANPLSNRVPFTALPPFTALAPPHAFYHPLLGVYAAPQRLFAPFQMLPAMRPQVE